MCVFQHALVFLFSHETERKILLLCELLKEVVRVK